MPIALSNFVCYALKLMFEESCIFGSKARGFFFCVGFFFLIVSLYTCFKENKTPAPLIWQKGVKFLIWYLVLQVRSLSFACVQAHRQVALNAVRIKRVCS